MGKEIFGIVRAYAVKNCFMQVLIFYYVYNFEIVSCICILIVLCCFYYILSNCQNVDLNLV